MNILTCSWPHDTTWGIHMRPGFLPILLLLAVTRPCGFITSASRTLIELFRRPRLPMRFVPYVQSLAHLDPRIQRLCLDLIVQPSKMFSSGISLVHNGAARVDPNPLSPVRYKNIYYIWCRHFLPCFTNYACSLCLVVAETHKGTVVK